MTKLMRYSDHKNSDDNALNLAPCSISQAKKGNKQVTFRLKFIRLHGVTPQNVFLFARMEQML
jgi:hypothetical protein